MIRRDEACENAASSVQRQRTCSRNHQITKPASLSGVMSSNTREKCIMGWRWSLRVVLLAMRGCLAVDWFNGEKFPLQHGFTLTFQTEIWFGNLPPAWLPSHCATTTPTSQSSVEITSCLRPNRDPKRLKKTLLLKGNYKICEHWLCFFHHYRNYFISAGNDALLECAAITLHIIRAPLIRADDYGCSFNLLAFPRSL